MLNVVDLASFQTGINAGDLPADAIIIKATEGLNYINPACNDQYASAKAGGKRVGLYHFADPGSDAITQANFFVNNVRNYIVDEHALPFLDWEADAIALGPAWAEQWLDEVARLTGASPMIYMSKATTNQYNWSSVAAKYGLWGAQYATTAPQYGFIQDPWTDDNAWGAWGVPTIFQYSSNGRLQGWDGGLDLSIAYLDGDTWDKFTTLGGSSAKADPVQPAAPAYKKAAIDGIFYVDQLVGWNGKWYVVNNDIAKQPVDFNNFIPTMAVTVTGTYGTALSDQSIGMGCFFTIGDAVDETYFDVTYLDDDVICLTMSDEPVWFDRKALGDSLKLQ